MTDYVVIFGAGVRADGSPSPTLRQRIEGAVSWSERDRTAVMMPTGGIGRVGPAEARVMERELLAAGVEPSRVVVEPTGRDTLESVRRCDMIIKERGDCERVVVCTSAYHQFRCALLFRLLGYRVTVAPLPSTSARLAVAAYVKAVAKEVLATLRQLAPPASVGGEGILERGGLLVPSLSCRTLDRHKQGEIDADATLAVGDRAVGRRGDAMRLVRPRHSVAGASLFRTSRRRPCPHEDGAGARRPLPV